MGFFKSIQRIFTKANNNVNRIMKVVDPVGGYLKEYTETNSQKDLMKMMGLGGGSSSYDDLGGTQKAVSDETTAADSKNKRLADRKRRQGPGGGTTLLTMDDSERLEKSTLLGL